MESDTTVPDVSATEADTIPAKPEQANITALLIEDNPGDAVLIREMLLDLPDSPFTVQWADQISKGLTRLENTHIDIVLLDLNLPDSSGLETFKKLYAAAPELPVIVLSGNEDEALALRAVREGAEDYLVKGTVTSESLGRCMRYTLERVARRKRQRSQNQQRHKPRGRVYGFIGAKGGVGTTTVVLNVAAALSGRKHTVIAAELRGSCGTLSHHFGCQLPRENLSALLRLSPGQINELELNARMRKYSSGFRVLFGPQEPREAAPLPEGFAGAVVGKLARMADFIILDLPSEPSQANREALQACDFAGIVVDREPSCVASAKIMAGHLNQWRIEALVGVTVVNRAPLVCPLDIEEIESELGLGVIALIPPAADACLLSQKAGSTLVATYASSLIGDSFVDLAAKLSEDPITVKKTA